MVCRGRGSQALCFWGSLPALQTACSSSSDPARTDRRPNLSRKESLGFYSRASQETRKDALIREPAHHEAQSTSQETSNPCSRVPFWKCKLQPARINQRAGIAQVSPLCFQDEEMQCETSACSASPKGLLPASASPHLHPRQKQVS